MQRTAAGPLGQADQHPRELPLPEKLDSSTAVHDHTIERLHQHRQRTLQRLPSTKVTEYNVRGTLKKLAARVADSAPSIESMVPLEKMTIVFAGLAPPFMDALSLDELEEVTCCFAPRACANSAHMTHMNERSNVKLASTAFRLPEDTSTQKVQWNYNPLTGTSAMRMSAVRCSAFCGVYVFSKDTNAYQIVVLFLYILLAFGAESASCSSEVGS